MLLLNGTLNDDAIKVIHSKIIDKLRKFNNDLINLKTGNAKLHTRIFLDLNVNYHFLSKHVVLETYEYPYLECLLDNGNYFLMTTERMFSTFEGKQYLLEYRNYRGSDWAFVENNKPIEAGFTKIFKYYSFDGNEFIYEIDSYFPAFFANNIILLYMKEVVQRIQLGTLDYFLKA
jgi:hypothetical protein